MLRLVKSVEERPEHSTVINWTVPVYIKNGEDYYKVCFDIKRKPLSDGTLLLTESELIEFSQKFSYSIKDEFYELKHLTLGRKNTINMKYENSAGYGNWIPITNYKAIDYLLRRFELTNNNLQLECEMKNKHAAITAEIEYHKENGDSIHSDLDFDFNSKEDMRKILHDCLDEWLNCSNGTGGFYLRNQNHHFDDCVERKREKK